jgi:hypothetical protein
MPTNQTNFFATYNDISSVLEQFERGEREGILYVLSGLFNVETPQILETYRALNSLSVSVDGDPNHVSGYLIVSDPKQIVVTEVPQKKGGSKFGIDQAGIPDSLYFQSGGVFGNEIIVPGSDRDRLSDPHLKKALRNFRETDHEEFHQGEILLRGSGGVRLMEKWDAAWTEY